MDDVVFGFVHDFGSREEWTARRGEGAWLNGSRSARCGRRTRSRSLLRGDSHVARRRDAPKVADLAHRLRIMGSLALSLCHLAAGRVDAVCSLKPARSVDIAAAQLLCRELGLAVELFDVEEPFGAAPLETSSKRSRVRRGPVPRRFMPPEICRAALQ
jgi:myo-inositol-1(or 4)-monophosphatase